MMLIGSSELRIGRVAPYLDPEIAILLQDARQAAIRTTRELAVKHGASAVLLAG